MNMYRTCWNCGKFLSDHPLGDTSNKCQQYEDAEYLGHQLKRDLITHSAKKRRLLPVKH